MKKAVILLVILAAVGGGGYAYYVYGRKAPEPTVSTALVSRGNIVDTVGTTGALSAVSQVLVGAQVSGIILELHADFNSIVKKGQLLARLDPSTIETQILQAQANLTRSQTDLDRSRVSLEDAQKKFQRSKDLFAKGIVNQADYDTAELAVRTAQSALKSSEAALLQSQASLKQNEVNQEHTVIYSPIDGLVISRAVDVGQTVSASMQAPTLFTIAADLSKMKVIAGVDESDVGRIRPNQHVTFRVDAYPNETFNGTVEQVRLEPKMQQNVVTYQTVITVPNPELKLKPGMTANINIEISRVDNVLRVPNTALRFRPTTEMYVALGLEPPADLGRGGRGGFGGRMGAGADGARGTAAGQPAAPAGTAPAAGQAVAPAAGRSTSAPAGRPATTTAPAGRSATAPAATAAAPARANGAAQQPSLEARGGRGAGPGAAGESNESREERMARFRSMTPEQREAFFAERRAAGGGQWGGDGRGGNANGGGTGRGNAGNGAPGGGTTAAGRSGNRATAQNATGRSGNAGNQLDPEQLAASRGATTIDALFPALPVVETRGRVWLWNKEKKALTLVPLRLGISDGQNTELLNGEVTEGTEVVTNILTASVRPELNQQQQGNPFLQQQQGGRGGNNQNRGGGGGGGFRGGF